MLLVVSAIELGACVVGSSVDVGTVVDMLLVGATVELVAWEVGSLVVKGSDVAMLLVEDAVELGTWLVRSLLDSGSLVGASVPSDELKVWVVGSDVARLLVGAAVEVVSWLVGATLAAIVVVVVGSSQNHSQTKACSSLQLFFGSSATQSISSKSTLVILQASPLSNLTPLVMKSFLLNGDLSDHSMKTPFPLVESHSSAVLHMPSSGLVSPFQNLGLKLAGKFHVNAPDNIVNILFS